MKRSEYRKDKIKSDVLQMHRLPLGCLRWI